VALLVTAAPVATYPVGGVVPLSIEGLVTRFTIGSVRSAVNKLSAVFEEAKVTSTGAHLVIRCILVRVDGLSSSQAR
jgi:hypothetical protein